MPTKDALADVRFASSDVEVELEPIEPEEEKSFRLLVLGDFCGQSLNRGRRPVRIDRDNFNDVLARFAPEIKLPSFDLRFTSLEEFHPDHIFSNHTVFRDLVALRDRPAAPPPARGAAAAAPRPPDLASGNLLDQMLDDSEPASQEAPRRPDEWQQFLRDLVGPHTVPKADSGQKEWEALVDAGISEQMRQVLHNAAFQSVESLWRATDLLVRRLDSDRAVHVYIADLPKKSLNITTLKAFLGERKWDAVVGAYVFTDAEDDVAQMLASAESSRRCGARFVAAASPQILGFSSFGEMPDPEDWKPSRATAWRALRDTSEGQWITLVAPRMLVRLPYGKNGETTENFVFEELGAPPKHEELLWGNGAFACALALSGENNEMDGLPVYSYRHDGEAQMVPCAEAWCGERAMEAMLENGLTPLLSVRNSDRVVMPRIRTVA